MKILILSPSNSAVGGVERFCNYLKDVYTDGGHEVDILFKKDSSFLDDFFKKIGLWSPYIGFVVGNLAKKQKFDLLITNGSLGWNINNGKIINIQHGTFAASADRIDFGNNLLKWFVKKFIWGIFEKIASKNASFAVAVSKETAEFVRKYYKNNRVITISNAINFKSFLKKDPIVSRDKFSLPKDKKLILFVGRFEYGKGSDIIDASLKRFTDNTVLVLASNVELDNSKTISLKDVPYNDLPDLYSACDLLIFPSRHEGASLALIEAMACEIPFLVTNVGSVSEILEENKIFENWVATLDNFEEKLLERLSKSEEDHYPEREVAEKLFSYERFKSGYLSLLDNFK